MTEWLYGAYLLSGVKPGQLKIKAKEKMSDIGRNHGHIKVVYTQINLANCTAPYVKRSFTDTCKPSKLMAKLWSSLITLLHMNLLFKLGYFCYMYYYF